MGLARIFIATIIHVNCIDLFAVKYADTPLAYVHLIPNLQTLGGPALGAAPTLRKRGPLPARTPGRGRLPNKRARF